MKSIWQRFKSKWQIESDWQLTVIMIVFGLTGFTSAFLKAMIYQWMGLTGNTPVWVKTIVLILLLIPVYKALLLFYGTVFGQFRFFKNFILRFLMLLGKVLRLQFISRP